MDKMELYYWMKFVGMRDKYDLLLTNWKALLVKEVDQERQIMERDKVIIALQDRVKQYETRL